MFGFFLRVLVTGLLDLLELASVVFNFLFFSFFLFLFSF